MEATSIFSGVPLAASSKASSRSSFPLQNLSYLSSFRPIRLLFLKKKKDTHLFSSSLAFQQLIQNNSTSSGSNSKTTTRRRSRTSRPNNNRSPTIPSTTSSSIPSSSILRRNQQSQPQQNQPQQQQLVQEKNRTVKKTHEDKEAKVSVRTLYQNGDPLGRRDLGKCVVKWISQGMRTMASEFASAEVQGEFSEVRQRMGPGLTFVIQAQPYLNAIPMPIGAEALCLKACTHYPTLFDHFQRELRDVLQGLQRNSQIESDWRETESWKLLKELANSAQHRAIARKIPQKPVHSGLGMDLEKARAIQNRIDDFTKCMSELLRIERDAELEFTQEELDAVPMPDENSNSTKPIEFLVSHGQAEQELCDTICNLNAISSSTGLGGMHLVLFRVEGNHRLPPTTLSPGDMVCVRTCDSRGAGATSCMQGFVHNLGEDGCSICVALESRHGDPTFSKLFGKNVRIDRIHGLADALTYEV
uniref:Uncharacterized protein n=1 Tax=Nelumbo nucifera TaxID=4432 RepID=A0A822XXL6_NELNU|nr:TPA_asm: hypothetical protein HUJ06_026521 [Nelumbo nucifera]